jgi:hypothetical protein
MHIQPSKCQGTSAACSTCSTCTLTVTSHLLLSPHTPGSTWMMQMGSSGLCTPIVADKPCLFIEVIK